MPKPKIIAKARKDIKAVRAGSKKYLILKASLVGVTAEQIAKLTGWSKSAASSAIATDLKPLGYLITKDGDVYTTVLPRGMKKPAVTKVVQS